MTKKSDRQAEDGSGDTLLDKYPMVKLRWSPPGPTLTHCGFTRSSGLGAWASRQSASLANRWHSVNSSAYVLWSSVRHSKFTCFMCVCICGCVCLHVWCLYVNMSVICAYACILREICVCLCIYMCVLIYMCVYIYILIMCAGVYMYAYVCNIVVFICFCVHV